MVDGGPGAPLDDDGINPTRALILQAYYGLRRFRTRSSIGTGEIGTWIEAHEPGTQVPSASLIQLTLEQAGVRHRGRGRPRIEPEATLFCALRIARPRSRSAK